MKAWIITMAFPCPSETFACNDTLALKNLGVELAVHGLRPEHRLSSKLLAERSLEKIWITHNSAANMLRGFWIGLVQPILLLDFVSWIIRHAWTKPSYLFKSLILVPRSLQIFDLVKRHNPDVVYLYWSHFPSLVGYLVQRKLPHIVVSISFVAHDIYYTEFDAKGSYTGAVARNADLVQTITVANIPMIEKYGISRKDILLSYHGINFSKVPKTKEKIKQRIITAGRLIQGKGFDDVLIAFSHILSHCPDASLIILGDGPERQKLEALACSLNISHAVDFRGFVSHQRAFEEMSSAEVFLFMSKSERLPNVVKEAMACHCLCVVSHTPGIEELVNDKVHGYIVQQGDVDSASNQVLQAFSNPEEMSHMTEIAYQHLKANFHIDRIIKNLKERWQKQMLIKQDSKVLL